MRIDPQKAESRLAASDMKKILLPIFSVGLMIGLIPFISNDYVLSGLYIAIIGASLYLTYEKRDLVLFALGFFVMLFSEYLFISTGVETFERNSLLSIMPLWLPFLWGYGFIAIRRLIRVIEKYGN